MTSGKTYTIRLSTKGQIVIPAPIRRALRLEPGQTLLIRETERGMAVEPSQAVFEPTSLEDVRAVLAYDGPTIPMDELGIEGLDYDETA